MEVKVHYTSAWYSIFLPIIVFLAVVVGVPLGAQRLLGWRSLAWLQVLVGILLGLVAAVRTYPLFMRLAERGRAVLRLDAAEGAAATVTLLRGSARVSVDLSRPHAADLSAGAAPASEHGAGLSLLLTHGSHDSASLYVAGLSRADVLDHFPHGGFVGPTAVSPPEGSWGAELDARDPAQRSFALGLLDALWHSRELDTAFAVYAPLPWATVPHPAFSDLRRLSSPPSAEERALVESILPPNGVEVLPGLFASADYVLSRAGGWDVVLPLGQVRARLVSDLPDRSGSTLLFEGHDAGGHPRSERLVLRLSQHVEREALMRFVNRRGPVRVGR